MGEEDLTISITIGVGLAGLILGGTTPNLPLLITSGVLLFLAGARIVFGRRK